MAVSLPSDLIADVMRAADPARLQTAAARLSQPARTAPAAGPAFATVLDAAAPQADASASRPLDQLVWQNLFETMLPREESGAFGDGLGANIWRSMAADQLATVAASAPGLALTPDAASGQEAGSLEASTGWPYFASAPIRSYAG